MVTREECKTNLSAVDVTCPWVVVERARETGRHTFPQLVFFSFEDRTQVLAFASSTGDWRPSALAASPQNRRMDGEEAVLRRQNWVRLGQTRSMKEQILTQVF